MTAGAAAAAAAGNAVGGLGGIFGSLGSLLPVAAAVGAGAIVGTKAYID